MEKNYYLNIVNDIDNEGFKLNFIVDEYHLRGRHYGYQPYYEMSWYDHCYESVQYTILPREIVYALLKTGKVVIA